MLRLTALAHKEATMSYAAVNLAEKLGRFSEHWSPRIVARMNDYHFKLVKIQGEFVWHSHADTDEVFIVLEGEMTIGSATARCAFAPARCSWSRRASSIGPLPSASAG